MQFKQKINGAVIHIFRFFYFAYWIPWVLFVYHADRKMADNNNLSSKSEFPQGNFEIVEDEKTETELNPDKIENEKSFWNTLWGALHNIINLRIKNCFFDLQSTYLLS